MLGACDRDCRIASGASGSGLAADHLAGDEEHDPAQNDCRSDEEDEAIDPVAEHAARCFALGDPEDRGSAEREEQYGGEMGGAHEIFLPVRRLCASTAAITLRRPATTMKRVP